MEKLRKMYGSAPGQIEHDKIGSMTAILFFALPHCKKDKEQKSADLLEVSATPQELEENAHCLTSPAEVVATLDPFLILSQIKEVYWDPHLPEGKIGVKLIITSNSSNGTSKDRTVQGVLGKAIGVSPFGVVHTAVQIANMVLEWTKQSVVVR